MSSTALAMRLHYYLRRKRLPFSIPTFIHRHLHIWYTKLMDSSPDGAMIVLGDFNQTMAAEKGGHSHYDPIRIWMEYYGLENFLWNACKEYPQQYRYSPSLHRQTSAIRDVTPKRITRNPIHLLHRPSPALSQVTAWSSIHPMKEGYTDHQLVIGDFLATPKTPLQALSKHYKAIPPTPRPGDIDLSNKDQKIKYANAVNATYFASQGDMQQLTPHTYEECEAILRNDANAICRQRHHSSGVPHPGLNPRYIAFMHHHKFL